MAKVTPMADRVTYCLTGGPPDNWADLVVRDPQGYLVRFVIEADSAEGWLVRFRLDDCGKLIKDGDTWATERVTGKFTIERKELK